MLHHQGRYREVLLILCRVPHPYKNSLIFDFFPFMTIIELPFIPACKRMAINTNAPKLGLQYSTSNDFFPETIEFLQKLGFISVLSIDMDIKYSFQKTNRSTILQGAEADIYDNDHAVSDTFFIYKITIPRPESPVPSFPSSSTKKNPSPSKKFSAL